MKLLDPRLYVLSFEMLKLAKYWTPTENRVHWIDIKIKLCLPFNPSMRLFSKTFQQIQFLLTLGKDSPRHTICASCHNMYKNYIKSKFKIIPSQIPMYQKN